MKNLHLSHIEDLVFEQPDLPAQLLTNLARGQASLTVKWDGAPAIVVGNDEQGFFLSKKSAFNKTPIRPRDIDGLFAVMPPDLAPVLADLFDYLYPYRDVFDGIWQGDLLFTPQSLHCNDNVMSFQPNVIKYIINLKDPEIPEFGVFWHTFYKKDSSFLWIRPPNPKIPGIWTPPESIIYYNIHNYTYTSHNLFSIGIHDTELHAIILQYINARLKQNQHVDFDDFANRKRKKLGFFEIDAYHIHGLFELWHEICQTKHEILKQLHVPNVTTFFVDQDNHDIPCAHEGYVLRDPSAKRMAKLVDRQTFSRANFNQQGAFRRGWQKQI